MHQLSLRDTTIALKLKMYLERKQALANSASSPFAQGPSLAEPRPVAMALITAKTNENMSTHDYDYTFWSIGDDERYLDNVMLWTELSTLFGVGMTNDRLS